MQFYAYEFLSSDTPDSSHIAGRHWVSEDGRQLDIQSVRLTKDPSDTREGLRVCVGSVGGKSEVLFEEGITVPDIKKGVFSERAYTQGVFHTKDDLKEWLGREFGGQEMVPVRNALPVSGRTPYRTYEVVSGDTLTEDFFLEEMRRVSFDRNDCGFGCVTFQSADGDLLEFRGSNVSGRDLYALPEEDRRAMTLEGGVTVRERRAGTKEVECLLREEGNGKSSGSFMNREDVAVYLSSRYYGHNLVPVEDMIDSKASVVFDAIQQKGSQEERKKALQNAVDFPKKDAEDILSFTGSKVLTGADFDRCLTSVMNNAMSSGGPNSVSLRAQNGFQMDIRAYPVETGYESFDSGLSVYAGKAGGKSKCVLEQDAVCEGPYQFKTYSTGICKSRQDLMDWIQKNCAGLSFSRVDEPLPHAEEKLERRYESGNPWPLSNEQKFDTTRLVWKEEPGAKPGEHRISFARACDEKQPGRDAFVGNPYLKNNRLPDGKVNHSITISEPMFKRLQQVSGPGGGPWQGVFNSDVIQKTSRVSYPDLSADALAKGRLHAPHGSFDVTAHDAFVKQSLAVTRRDLPPFEPDRERSVSADLSLG